MLSIAHLIKEIEDRMEWADKKYDSLMEKIMLLEENAQGYDDKITELDTKLEILSDIKEHGWWLISALTAFEEMSEEK